MDYIHTDDGRSFALIEEPREIKRPPSEAVCFVFVWEDLGHSKNPYHSINIKYSVKQDFNNNKHPNISNLEIRIGNVLSTIDYRSTSILPEKYLFWSIIENNNKSDLFRYTHLMTLKKHAYKHLKRFKYQTRWKINPFPHTTRGLVNYIIEFDPYISLNSKIEGYFDGVACLNLYPSWKDVQLIKDSHKLLNL